jgi:formamidopyrimidine-DNA glycosylase
MPELPEVETVLQGLRKRVLRRKILKVVVENPRSIRPERSKNFARQITGKTILGLSRTGKWICFHLTDDINLWAHLGMTGRFLWNKPDSYTRVLFILGEVVQGVPTVKFCDDAIIPANAGIQTSDYSKTATLYFSDIRTLGRMIVTPSGSREPPGVTLGIDPINDELTGKYLWDRFRNHAAAIKDMLLNQAIIAGIGNIYATEILFDAKLHPLRQANSLSKKECTILAKCTVSCMQHAIRYGGTTISDFLTLDGDPGGFEEHIRIYGKQGTPCPECGTTLVRYVLHQRSGVFCPKCQH